MKTFTDFSGGSEPLNKSFCWSHWDSGELDYFCCSRIETGGFCVEGDEPFVFPGFDQRVERIAACATHEISQVQPCSFELFFQSFQCICFGAVKFQEAKNGMTSEWSSKRFQDSHHILDFLSSEKIKFFRDE